MVLYYSIFILGHFFVSIFIHVIPSCSFKISPFFRSKYSIASRVRLSADEVSAPNSPLRVTVKPEFSRIVNVKKIPHQGSATCRIIANNEERRALSLRFRTHEISELAANVTLSRISRTTPGILLQGSLCGSIIAATFSDSLVLHCNFTSKLIGSATALEMFISDPTYDDIIPLSGDVDIGEIVAQHFSLELGNKHVANF